MSEVKATLVQGALYEPEAIVVELPQNMNETVPDTMSGVEAEIALAEIRAETDIELAEISAEVSMAAIDAENEREQSWQERANELQDRVNDLTETVNSIMETVLLIPLPSLPSPGETETTTTIVSSVTEPETLSSEPTESPSESAEEKPVAEIAAAAAAEATAEAAHEKRVRARMI